MKQDLTAYCKYVLNTEDYEIFEDAGYSGKTRLARHIKK